eukprot:TRINITY_DN95947_c0_g1_i1.p1 TRINITY_DN95947_c0_g1~~TRINITY_DN95947_c0_g1_i1.p1  ORF type:complete len:240 (-),score=36.37 TRINITY_DN95947_c0_g1_i1:104-823(-)
MGETVTVGGVKCPITYFDPDPQVLKAVKKFPPFAEWATSVKPTKEFVTEGIHVHNIDWVAKRIDSVKFCVSISTVPRGPVVQHFITVSDTPSARIVLPQVLFQKRRHILLAQPNARIIGTGGASGGFEALRMSVQNGETTFDSRDALLRVGLDIKPGELKPIGRKLSQSTGSTDSVQYFTSSPPAPVPDDFENRLRAIGGFALIDVQNGLQGSLAAARLGGVKITDSHTIFAICSALSE